MGETPGRVSQEKLSGHIVKLLAPAKINLHLRVAPVASDGFHPLLSWMCTVGLFDTLILNRAAGSGTRLQCDDPTLPCDGSNLVVRAAAAIRDAAMSHASRRTAGEGGLAIELQKRIFLPRPKQHLLRTRANRSSHRRPDAAISALGFAADGRAHGGRLQAI
jgi:hypothetical protein